MQPRNTPLRRAATLALLVLEALIAAASAVLAIAMLGAFDRSASDAYDYEWSMFTLAVASTAFVCFGIAAAGLATSWRYKWWLQAVPICALVAGILIFVLAV
jgi:cell division protein FtsW (lipid II flippase)